MRLVTVEIDEEMEQVIKTAMEMGAKKLGRPTTEQEALRALYLAGLCCVQGSTGDPRLAAALEGKVIPHGESVDLDTKVGAVTLRQLAKALGTSDLEAHVANLHAQQEASREAAILMTACLEDMRKLGERPCAAFLPMRCKTLEEFDRAIAAVRTALRNGRQGVAVVSTAWYDPETGHHQPAFSAEGPN